jgi:hypothetical protein
MAPRLCFISPVLSGGYRSWVGDNECDGVIATVVICGGRKLKEGRKEGS